ncbi:hypothetical protein [Sneathiella glossodoripedis]|uniref:hypothetical protein n=1 Tax=Sneathiella glossodoripedis TaxID=418853 RepID=UPI0004703416|nr:hypothetical protein [Sneathiella glossodoripedis]
MHNCFTEESLLNLTGPGKQVAIRYVRWKLEREIRAFQLKTAEMIEKIEESLFLYEQAMIAQE